jgi:hypothetical protein
MGFLKKIFGDDEEKEREEAVTRAAAERYAEEHSHSKEAEHETPAAKKAAAKKTAEKAEPKAAAKKTAEKAEPEKLTATKSASAKAATAKPETKAEAKVEAPAAKPAAKKSAVKVVAAPVVATPEVPHTHDPIPAQRTYAPLSGAPAASAHTHVHDVAEGPVTAAHDQMMTIHVETHVPDHSPREDDPHYHLFELAKARLKRQGLWKCIIGDDLCGGEPELHHTFIEFSQINDVDPAKLQEALGVHFANDEDFQKWAESPGNLEVLCANHHRTHYGIHVIPGPLWEALRFRLVGTEAPAEFVTADEAKDEAKKAAAAS